MEKGTARRRFATLLPHKLGYEVALHDPSFPCKRESRFFANNNLPAFAGIADETKDTYDSTLQCEKRFYG